jgi:hypothetical protein
MSQPLRTRGRRDSNEKAVVQALEKAGALVLRLSAKGVGDLLVYRRAWGRPDLTLLEVKRPKLRGQQAGTPTKAQQQAQQQGWPVVRVETPEQALAAIGCVTR